MTTDTIFVLVRPGGPMASDENRTDVHLVLEQPPQVGQCVSLRGNLGELPGWEFTQVEDLGDDIWSVTLSGEIGP